MTASPTNDSHGTRHRRSLYLSALCAALCILTLHELDSKQSQLQNLSMPGVPETLRAAHLEALVRGCLAAEPLGAAQPDAGAPPGAATVGSDARAAAEAVARERAARRCELASGELKRLSPQLAVDGLWKTVFTEGSSLNTVLRLTRVVLLSLFALCVAHMLLRALKAMGLPVASFEELTRLPGDLVQRAAPAEPGPGKSAAALLSVVGTTLVTGVTGAAVVVPELVQQTVNTTRVAESRRLDVRNIQSVTRESRLELVSEHSEIRDADASVAIAELREKLSGVDARLLQVTLGIDALRRAELTALTEFQHRLLDGMRDLGKPPAPDPGPALRELDAKVTALSVAQRDAFAAQEQKTAKSNDELQSRIVLAERSASGALGEIAAVRRSVDQRGCATLAYFEHLEDKRWFFPKEARARIQLLRDIMGTAQPTQGCDQFRRPAALVAGGSPER